MASPCPESWGVGEASLVGRTHVPAFVLRVGRLALVTSVVGVGTWMALGPNPIARTTAVAATRAAPAARGAVLGVEAAPLTVSVDGLVASVRTSSETVADALRGLGLVTGRGDRLSSPGEAPVVPGQRLALDRGLPVTLIDGATRSRPGPSGAPSPTSWSQPTSPSVHSTGLTGRSGPASTRATSSGSPGSPSSR